MPISTGPSQPKMMGVDKRPASPDGKRIIPPEAHGVRMISIGLMLKGDDAVIWRGPMLMGALQQLFDAGGMGPAGCLAGGYATRHRRYSTNAVHQVQCARGDRGVDPRRMSRCWTRAKRCAHFETLKTPVFGADREYVDLHLPAMRSRGAYFRRWRCAPARPRSRACRFWGNCPLSLEVRLAGDGGRAGCRHRQSGGAGL